MGSQLNVMLTVKVANSDSKSGPLDSYMTLKEGEAKTVPSGVNSVTIELVRAYPELEKVEIFPKPFTPAELLDKVSEMLNAPKNPDAYCTPVR